MDLLRKLLRSNPRDNIGARHYILVVRLGMTFAEFEMQMASVAETAQSTADTGTIEVPKTITPEVKVAAAQAVLSEGEGKLWL